MAGTSVKAPPKPALLQGIHEAQRTLLALNGSKAARKAWTILHQAAESDVAMYEMQAIHSLRMIVAAWDTAPGFGRELTGSEVFVAPFIDDARLLLARIAAARAKGGAQ